MSTLKIDVEQAKKMARIRTKLAGPVWGMTPEKLAWLCLRKEIPGATKKGKFWYVTFAGMEQYFNKRR